MPDGVEVRWMYPADIAAVVEIGGAVDDAVWDADDLEREIKPLGRVGRVAVRGGRVVAYMIEDMHITKAGTPAATEREISRLVVAADCRRQGIGRHILEARIAAEAASYHPRPFLVRVHERNLTAQLFLRALQFRAERVEPLPGTGDAAYIMVRRATETGKVAV